jgi:hypothetical protein
MLLLIGGYCALQQSINELKLIKELLLVTNRKLIISSEGLFKLEKLILSLISPIFFVNVAFILFNPRLSLLLWLSQPS